MTEHEIVTAVMNLVTSHEGVTNTSLSPDQVGEEVDTLRVRMADEMDKVSLLRRPYLGFTQQIDSLEVLKTSDGLTRYVDIPRMVIKRDNNPAFLYVGGKDNKSPYRVITGDQAENVKHDLFLQKLPVAIYTDGHFEFRNIAQKYIKIVAMFEDPGALEVYGKWDIEINDYPMPAGMIDQLIGKTANTYINSLYRTSIQPNTQSDKPIAAQQNARR